MIVTGGNVIIRWWPGRTWFVVASYVRVDGPFLEVVDVDVFPVEA